MTLPLFYGVTEDGVRASSQPHMHDVSVGQKLLWWGSEAHHCLRVQRLRIGDKIELMDGRGRRLRCEICEINAQEPCQSQLRGQAHVNHSGIRSACLHLVVSSICDEPSPYPEIILVQALAKGGRDEQSVESCTELGVNHVIPWMADRCVSRWVGAKKEKGKKKWLHLIQAATKQSRRSWQPTLGDMVTTDSLVNLIKEASSQGDHIFVLWEDSSYPLAKEAMKLSLRYVEPLISGDTPYDGLFQPRNHSSNSYRRLWLVVGPEGGMSSTEVERLCQAGARHVKLGSTIMRVSSAGPAAMAVLSYALGRWNYLFSDRNDVHEIAEM